MTADELRRKLGVYVQFGMGGAWPQLRQYLGRIVTDKVAAWPWMPRSWVSDYLTLQSADPSSLVRIAPANVIVPEFCDNPAKVTAWNELAAQVDYIVGKYAAGEQDAGRAELEALYARAEFWNTGAGAGLITAAEAIRDLPASIVGGIADGAQAVAGGIFKRLFSSWLFWLVVIGALGFAAWRFGLVKLPKAKGG